MLVNFQLRVGPRADWLTRSCHTIWTPNNIQPVMSSRWFRPNKLARTPPALERPPSTTDCLLAVIPPLTNIIHEFVFVVIESVWQPLQNIFQAVDCFGRVFRWHVAFRGSLRLLLHQPLEVSVIDQHIAARSLGTRHAFASVFQSENRNKVTGQLTSDDDCVACRRQLNSGHAMC